MNVGQLLLVLHDVLGLLASEKILLPDGSWDKTKLDTIKEDIAFAVAIEAILKNHGVVVPANVDKIIQLVLIVSQFIK